MKGNDLEAVGVFEDPAALDSSHTGDENSKARRRILPWILAGYLAMLALSVTAPMFLAPRWSDVQTKQVQDLMVTIGGLSQGLFGVLGVVVGYYFRQVQEGESNST